MARRKRYNIDEYKKLWDIRCKAMLTAAVIVAFFIVLIRMMFFSPSWLDIGKCTVVEAFLAGTIYVAFKHYFPPAKADG